MMFVVEPLRITLARNITEAIEGSSFSVKDIAQQLGLSETSIHRWKNGSNPPDVGNLEALSKLLKIDPADFYKTGHHPHPVINLTPRDALRKLLIVPDEIIEELAELDLSDDSHLWDNIRTAIDIEKADQAGKRKAGKTKA
jgi:transcriptional regulator with XRE-family HTH domain